MSWPELDMNLLRGLSLVLLIVAFVGMWIWAWSDKRKDAFKELSELPLEEDHGIIPDTDTGTESDKNGSKE